MTTIPEEPLTDGEITTEPAPPLPDSGGDADASDSDDADASDGGDADGADGGDADASDGTAP